MQIWLKAARLQVHAASILPAVLGSAYAYHVTGRFNWPLFLLTLAGVAFIHAASNMINDYFDHQTGTDDANQTYLQGFSGGSRVLVEGAMAPKTLRNGAFLCFGIGAAIGLVITAFTGLPVLVIGLFGIVTSILYVWPRFSLTDKGLGELIVGLDFGVLIVLGAYYVQAGQFTWQALWVSLPMALVVASILMVNQLPDYDSDRLTGKMTSAVRMGRRKSAGVLVALLYLTVAIVAAAIPLGILPFRAGLALLALPVVLSTSAVLRERCERPEQLVPAALGVIQCHVLTALFVISALVPGPWGYGLTALPLLLCIKTYKELHVVAKGWIS